MGYESLLQIIDQLGYIAFFLALCLGLIGLPIPNEVVVMTGGAVAASGLLAPVPVFIAVYLGIVSGLTFGYAVGRGAGGIITRKFADNKNVRKFQGTAELLDKRYGKFAISISIFLPLLRHIMMYVAGLNRLAYWRLLAFAYPTAFVWTLGYFIVGTYVGSQIDQIGREINRYGMIAVWIIIGAGAVFILYRALAYHRAKQEERSIDS